MSAGMILCLAGVLGWQPAPVAWDLQPTGTTERLRGVAVVSERVVWASGANGTCLRTVDGGEHWERVAVSHAEGLDFRDVHADDMLTAYLLAIGPGEASRIKKTTNGGRTWVESYRNHDPNGFLDAIAFWDRDHGLALGDPVDGRFVILATDDGGKTWDQTSGPGTMPGSLPNEGAFAASGTCLIVGEGGMAWFATGGATTARVFRSTDRGRSWVAAATPIRAGGPSMGIFGLAFRDARHGVAVGGDYKAETETTGIVATTSDGGATWTTPEAATPSMGTQTPGPRGFRSAVAYVPPLSEDTILTVGPTGTDQGSAGKRSWRPIQDGVATCFGPNPTPTRGWHALGIDPTGRFAWGVGEAGQVGRMDLPRVFKAR